VSINSSWTLIDVPTSGSILIYSQFVQTVFTSRLLPSGFRKNPFDIALGRWGALLRFCDDGRIEIDNNAAERALRVVALGRKNFLLRAPMVVEKVRLRFTVCSVQ
jgi:hypothetical protein